VKSAINAWKDEVDDEVFEMIRNLDIEFVSEQSELCGRFILIIKGYE
jgi:hypothetical protein